ncbi:lmo0937 family membrane protein [Gaetbulibacter aquiaggeris]|uniref:Lmo0937 family membrane protein n=1 Tax=Gaetbulibacter aquiaggeris TaxID=1735373 RepID=A0ABW7MSQ8_9FLAO
MRSLLYIVAVVLVIGWALGFFVYSSSGIIHILLVLAVIAILLRLIGGKRI